jgi:hypothetical protein
MKTFDGELNKILEKLKNKENFAFARFSDGELHMLQNMYFKITDDHFIEGDKKGMCKYTAEEHKEFDPAKHAFYRDKLEESFKFRADNYFKGICARKDVGEKDFRWQLDLNGGHEDDLTFSNVFINANYKRFIEEAMPEIKKRPVVMICNEAAELSGFSFPIVKEFRVGSNCVVNDYDIIEEIKGWISAEGIHDHIFLCSAASLSNFIIHQCYEEFPDNTYLDIGSALNPWMGLEGWMYSRGYLQHWVLGHRNRYGEQVDVW